MATLMNRAQEVDLEVLVNDTSLHAVIEQLSRIAFARAEHLRRVGNTDSERYVSTI